MSYQVLGTQSFIAGNGIGIPMVLPGDLTTIYYEHLIMWPPGYSFLLAPYLLVFKNDFITAVLTLDITSAIILIFISRSILRSLGVPIYLANIYTLFIGFFNYNFYNFPSSDSIAITLYAISLYFSIVLLKKDKSSISNSIGVLAPLILAAFVKYLFIPLVFTIPLLIYWKGHLEDKRYLKRFGLFVTVVLALAIGSLLIWQKLSAGSAIYIAQPERGFFPGNLLESYPFFPGAFIKMETTYLLFPGKNEIQNLIFATFQVIHVLFIIGCIFYIYQRLFKKRTLTLPIHDSIFFLTFIVSLVITLFLSALSLTVAKENWDGNIQWTYVQEPRYYGIMAILAHICLFVYLYNYYRKSHLIIRFVFFLFAGFMTIESLRGFYFMVNRVKNYKSEIYLKPIRDPGKYVEQKIKNELVKYGVKDLVVAGPHFIINNLSSLQFHSPILANFASINQISSLKTKKSLLLLVSIHEESLHNFKPFREHRDVSLTAHIGKFYIYTLYIPANN